MPQKHSGTPIPDTLSAPAKRAVQAAGYKTLEELLAVKENDLLALHGIGPKGVRLIHEAANKVLSKSNKPRKK